MITSFGPAILAKATLILLLALFAARVARRGRASVRHLLLSAAFAVLLVLPLAALLTPSVPIDVAPVSLALEPYVGEIAFIESRPSAHAVNPPFTAVPSWQQRTTLQYIAAGWMGGVVLFALPMLIGVVHVRRLRRTGVPWIAGQRMVDSLALERGLSRRAHVLLHQSISVPATCGVRNHTILFPIDVTTWSAEDVRRAAIHELEHVRRSDCFINAFTRLICALYWCQPLAWVAWRRLALEAERACDDAVLDRADATIYADQLVALAGRVSTDARHPLLAMANRSDLARRVAALLDQHQPRGHVGRALGAVIVSTACLLTSVISPLHAVNIAPSRGAGGSHGEPPSVDVVPRLRAPGSARADESARTSMARASAGMRSPKVRIDALQNVAAGAPRFEVVSIRQNTSGSGAPTTRVEGGRYVASNVPLQQLISDAYRMPVVGGPAWATSPPGPRRGGEIRFDVVATIPSETPVAQIPLLLRTLLAERFRMTVHTEVQEREAYALVHARDDKRLGPQLTPSSQQCPVEIEAGPLRAPVRRVTEDGKPVCSMMQGPAAIRGGGLTLRFLASALGVYAGRLVVDRTHLEGPFDFELTYAPAPRGAGPAPADDRPSIFVAVQEQFGLKLEPTTAAVEVLVVDSVSMPTEN